MPVPPIIEHLDIFEDVLLRFFTGHVVPMVQKLALERPEETLDTDVVPAVVSAAHAWRRHTGQDH